jgi:WhiB family redox-sensing transcriptional regulator
MTGKLLGDGYEHRELMRLYAALDKEEWQVPCVQAPDLYFPERPENMKADVKGDLALANMAKDACLDCPVMMLCLEVAVNTRREYGIWGGTNWHERKAIIRLRKKGKKVD